MRRPLVLLACMFSMGLAMAQVTEKQVSSTPDGRIKVGPDPTDNEALYRFLQFPYVRDELELAGNQETALSEIYTKYKSTIGLRSLQPGVTREQMRIRRSELAVNAVEEILLPKQVERLRQIAFRYEVSAVGFGNSLVYGRLGEKAGVHAGQHEDLLRASKKIDEEMRNAIREAIATAERRLAESLTPEQNMVVRKTIGPLFVHENTADVAKIFNRELENLHRNR